MFFIISFKIQIGTKTKSTPPLKKQQADHVKKYGAIRACKQRFCLQSTKKLSFYDYFFNKKN